MAAVDRSDLPVTLPLGRALRTGVLLTALFAVSWLVDWRLVALIAVLSVAGFAARSLRSHLLADDERLVGCIADALATGWFAAAVLFVASLPPLAFVAFAGVGLTYLALASVTAHLLLSGTAGFLAGRDAGLALLRFFDAVREAWLPRPRVIACSLGLFAASAETLALSVLLFSLLQLGLGTSMAAALLLRTAIAGAAWVHTSRSARAAAEVIELPRASYEASDRDIAA
jgi:hypothetical protein